MALSDEDRRLVSRVRAATGATNESQMPPEVLESEVENAKQHLSDELNQALDTGTYNFYNNDAETDLLEAFLSLRVWSLQREQPEQFPATLSSMRRFDYGNPQATFWRDEAVRAFTALTNQ